MNLIIWRRGGRCQQVTVIQKRIEKKKRERKTIAILNLSEEQNVEEEIIYFHRDCERLYGTGATLPAFVDV